MTRRLDEDSRSILEFRPVINFVEPDVEPGTPDPIYPDTVTVNDIVKEMDKTRSLARAVDVLATAVQERVDQRAAGMKVKLDPSVDTPVIAAMRRMYPENNPREITYEQYKECKERMRKRGIALAEGAMVKPEDVSAAKEELGTGTASSQGTDSRAVANRGQFSRTAASRTGGFGTEEAATGQLRPELYPQGQIVESLDIPQIQDVLIKILVNFIWKNFIKPFFVNNGGVFGQAARFLPDIIIELPPGFTVADIIGEGGYILGENPPKQQALDAPEIPSSIQVSPETTSIDEAEEENV